MICILNKQRKPGVLKFIGETKFSSGVWCGIALRDPCGKNDGSVAGVRYFQCEELHGIFVNPKNVFPAKNEQNLHEIASKPAMTDEVSLSSWGEHHASDSFEDCRPRSKSDLVIKEKKADYNIFSCSPFKCNIRSTKSSSLSNLNNATYICLSPVLKDNDGKNVCDSHDTDQVLHDERKNDDMALTNIPNASHLHSDLSPKLEVKQSIKLDSINSARFPAPTNLEKDKDTNLNKTFLVRTRSPGVGKECEKLCDTLVTDLKEGTVKSDDFLTKETSSCTNMQNLNASAASINESDDENTRPRTGSKSSWSSVESLSSVGSVKSNRERSRLNGTKTPRKLPCPTECSKSKFVRISADKKEKPKVTGRETATTTFGKQTSKSTGKLGANVVDKKSRTKSTSVVAPRSALAVSSLSASKSTVKSKSKSVSSDIREIQPLGKSNLNPSKFATPLSSKISANRLTSTPISKRTVGLEKKSRLNGSSGVSRITAISSLSNSNCDDKPSISKENSDVGSTVSSLPARKNYQKEKEAKPNFSKSRNLSTSSASNKSLSTKTKTLSVSAVPKLAGHESISTKILSTPCTIKEEIKPRTSRLRSVSTSKAGHQNGEYRTASHSIINNSFISLIYLTN